MNILVNRLEHEEIAKADSRRRDAGTAALAGGAVASHTAASELRGHAMTRLTAAHEGGGLTYRGQDVFRAKAAKQLKGSRAAAAGTALLAAGAIANTRRRSVSKSAFGVELGKAMPWRGARKLARKAPEAMKMEFKKPKPGVVPSGPGSKRGSMSQSAWETRMAARRRD